MLKKANHLASLTERTKALSYLPKSLLERYNDQKKLNQAFLEALSDVLPVQTLSACTAVHYKTATLVIATSNQTLVSHLTYLTPKLLDALSAHRDFRAIKTLSVVYTKPAR